MAQNHKINIIVTHSYRYPNQELAQTIVSPSKTSNHLVGYAIDFNISYQGFIYKSEHLSKTNFHNLPKPILAFINKIRRDTPLQWGGDFTKEDPIHLDYPLNKKSLKQWDLNFQNCQEDWSQRSYKWIFWK